MSGEFVGPWGTLFNPFLQQGNFVCRECRIIGGHPMFVVRRGHAMNELAVLSVESHECRLARFAAAQHPIAHVEADGTAVITKPAGSGGRVTTDTLRHQLLYEVHDPARYVAPEVVADFTSAQFEDLPDDRVRITGVRGTPATDTYKLLVAYHAGWSGEARVAFSWPDAHAKAKATAAILVKRVEMAGLPVDEWHVEYWGVNALGGPTVPVDDACEPPECVLRVAWRCSDQRTAALVGRELTPLTLSAPPAGMTGSGRGGGSSATELLGIWPSLVRKDNVDPNVRVVLEEVT